MKGGGHFCHIFSTQLWLSPLEPGYLLLLSNSTFYALQTSAEIAVEVARMFLIPLKTESVSGKKSRSVLFTVSAAATVLTQPDLCVCTLRGPPVLYYVSYFTQ